MKKFAVITGASGGIGGALTQKFTLNGYTVVAQYRNHELAPQRDVIPVYGDFSTCEGVAAFVKEVHRICDPEVLINNAGIALEKMLWDHTDEEIEKLVFTDFTAPIILTREFSRKMAENRHGSIINISSIWGVAGGSCETVYAGAKGGIVAFTKAIAKELGLSKVRINCIAPGFIDTNMNARYTEEERKEFFKNVALGRAGKPSEIADVALFLAENASSYITGQIILADGGFV